jgi:predicted nuclease of restriction endonuclease-like (RecB) superfamily
MAKKRPAKPGASPRRSVAKRAADVLPHGYAEFLDGLKARIRTAQVRAALAVNRELVALYWEIGRAVVERQEAEGWGRSVIERLAKDLQAAFPGVGGFSPSNVWRMRAFYLAYTADVRNLAQPVRELDGSTLPAPMAEIPWGHNILLVEKLSDPSARLWYARMTTEQGWSRSVLVLQIEAEAHRRHGKALTNFADTLPSPQSDLARDLLKDPYNFDFLTLAGDVQEKHLQAGLLEHLRGPTRS